MWDFDPNQSEEQLRAQEQEELERLVRNGANSRQIARRHFMFVQQSDIMKMYRKFGKDMNDEDDEW